MAKYGDTQQDVDWNELLKVMQAPSRTNSRCQIVATSYESLDDHNYEHRASYDHRNSREKRTDEAVCVAKLRRIFASCCAETSLATRVNDLEFKVKRLEKIYCRKVKKQLDELYGQQAESQPRSSVVSDRKKSTDSHRRNTIEHYPPSDESNKEVEAHPWSSPDSTSSESGASPRRSGSLRRHSGGSGHINSAVFDHNKRKTPVDEPRRLSAAETRRPSDAEPRRLSAAEPRRLSAAEQRRPSAAETRRPSAAEPRRLSADESRRPSEAERRRSSAAERRRSSAAERRRSSAAERRRPSAAERRRSSAAEPRRPSAAEPRKLSASERRKSESDRRGSADSDQEQRRTSTSVNRVVFRRDSSKYLEEVEEEEAFSDDSSALEKKENYFFITTSPSFFDNDEIPVRDVTSSLPVKSAFLRNKSGFDENQKKSQWLKNMSLLQRSTPNFIQLYKYLYDEEAKKARSLKNLLDNKEAERPPGTSNKSFVEYTSILKQENDLSKPAVHKYVSFKA